MYNFSFSFKIYLFLSESNFFFAEEMERYIFHALIHLQMAQKAEVEPIWSFFLASHMDARAQGLKQSCAALTRS